MQHNTACLHPFTLGSVCLQALAFSLIGDIFGCLLGLMLILGLAAWSGITWEWITRLLKSALPLTIFVFLLQAVLSSEGSSGLFKLGELLVTEEGLFRASVYTARIFLLLGVVLVFSRLSNWFDLGAAFLDAGLPLVPTYILISSATMIPEMQIRFKRVIDAQRCRGVEVSGSLLARARKLPSFLLPVLLGALFQAASRSIALEARGFSVRERRVTPYRELPDSAGQRFLRRAFLATFSLTVAASLLVW